VLIQVGAIDSLHDEGLLLAKRLHEQRQLDCAWLEHIQDPQSATINSESGNQNSIKCEIYSDMPHVFQLFWPLGNQMSRLAVQRGCRFINKSLTE
jgi:hypothetical protein